MSDQLLGAAIAAVVSLFVAGLTNYVAIRRAAKQMTQAQFREILQKRIEHYPELWAIHIGYETNWSLEGRRKDHEWARAYLEALNGFNLHCGVFFSEGVYKKFAELRSALHAAVEATAPGEAVHETQTAHIRSIVYGSQGDPASGRSPIPGLSTLVKDDLGSYRSTSLQLRREAV